MKQLGGAGFLGLAPSLRSLTRSPLQSLLNEAHKMARRHLEAGGPAAAPPKQAKAHRDGVPFVLPADIDPSEFAQSIRAKPGYGDSDDDLYPLKRKKLGGRVVLHGRHVLRLGDGRFSEGRAFLHGLVKDLRAKRWRRRFTPR